MKKGLSRRALAIVLTFAMVVCMFSHVGSVSKAAATYSGSLTLEGSQVEHDEIVDIMAKNVQIYLCGDSGLASVPADSSWGTRYKAAADDANSGIFVDGIKQESGQILKYSGDQNWWFAEGFAPSAGQTLTIKGAFVNGSTTVNITELNLIWDGTRFTYAKETANMELVDIVARGDGDATGFYITTQKKGVQIDDGMAYNGDWSLKVYPKHAAYSGVLVDGKYHPVFLKKLDKYTYYVCLIDKGITATTDMTITIRGQFYYEDYVVDFNEITCKFDGTTWTSTKKLQSGELQITGSQLGTSHEAISNTNIYLGGDSVLDSAIKAPADGNWDDKLIGKTDADGVFLNGVKASSGQILKYHNTSNWWFAEGFGAAAVGDIVTIKGDFVMKTNGTPMIHIKESSFKWTGSYWTKIMASGSVSVTGAQIVTTNPAQLYLKGSDSLDAYKIGSDNDWSHRLYALGDTDGIYLNNSKASGATIYKYSDYENRWFAEGFGTAAEGDILTIKGDFAIGSTLAYMITFEESSYQYTGGQWVNYENDSTVYTSFTVNGVHENTALKDGANWHFYLNTDTVLPGNAWGSVNDVPEYFAMSATLNGTDITLNAKKWDTQGLFLEIPIDTLPLGSSITVKAGKYKSNVQGIGYDVTADFSIYVSETGVSLKQNLKCDTSVKPSFTMDANNANTSASGVYLTINTNDGMLGSGDWQKKLYPLHTGITKDAQGKIFVGGEYGLWKGDTYTGAAIPIVKLSDSSYYVALSDVGYAATAAGDTYTLQGMFYDQNHRIVEYEPIVLTWDGSRWSTQAEWTSFNLSGLRVDTACNESNWHVYLNTDTELPGTAWGSVNGTPEAYQVNITINGTPATITAKKCDAKALFLEFSNSLLAAGEEATLVVKAGRYRSNVQDIGLELTADFTIYINKYGWSTKGAIVLGQEQKPQFTLDPNAASASATGFVLLIDSSDGTPEANGWSTRLFPVMKSLSDDEQTFYYAPTMENGLWKNGVHITTKADGNALNSESKPLVKLNETEYYVGIGDWGYTAQDGDRYTLGGVFYDSTGRLLEYQPITVEYNATTGKWQNVYVALPDSGVENDINADGKVDSCDLVRFLRWKKNGMTSINDTRADVNLSGTTNAKDVASMRKILVGSLFYNGTDRTPYGMPYYTKDDQIEKLAYASPSVGTYDASTLTYTRRSDEAAIDADFEKFKAAGLTLLNSENRAMLTVEAWDHVSNQAIKEYLVEAQEHGLGVIVYCQYLQFLLNGGVDLTEAAHGTFRQYRWQEIMDDYIKRLSAYPSFKGFMMSDELSITYFANYQAVASFLRANYPGLMMHSSQLPVSVYEQDGGAGNLTLDTSTNNTKEKAYRDYVYNFGMAAGHYTYDLYPLTVKTPVIGSKTYGVNSEWFDNLNWVAKEKQENGYAFTSGITIQSCALPQDAANWWQSTVERYAPTTKADMGFQIYTALAYGMEEINFFTYEDHWQANVTDAMADNASVYNAVKTVNAEIDAFGHVFKAFDWKETLDIAAGSSSSTALSPRLASASVTGYRTLVGCMQDEEGFDGYMIANAAGPRTSTSATVTLTFNNAEKAIVYKNGVKSIVTLTNGAYTVSVGVGEGVFVIPYREKKN